MASINIIREKLTELANSYGIYMDDTGILANTYYIGDDIPDLECMLIAERRDALAMR